MMERPELESENIMTEIAGVRNSAEVSDLGPQE